jgi:hypothetical protein
VRALAEKKVKMTIGMNAEKWIDIEVVSHTTGSRKDTKNLSME